MVCCAGRQHTSSRGRRSSTAIKAMCAPVQLRQSNGDGCSAASESICSSVVTILAILIRLDWCADHRRAAAALSSPANNLLIWARKVAAEPLGFVAVHCAPNGAHLSVAAYDSLSHGGTPFASDQSIVYLRAGVVRACMRVR